jgi:uncharacterized membrane protein required for colicin V production
MLAFAAMTLDILIAIWVITAALRGRQRGVSAGVIRLGIALLAAFLAVYCTPPVAGVANKVLAWTPAGIAGLSFLILFGIIYMVGVFSIGTTVRAMEYSERSGALDELGGLLFSAARIVVLVFLVLSGAIFLSRELGATSSNFAIDYSSSIAGRYALVHNFLDTEPFPHALVLGQVVERRARPELSVNRRVALSRITGVSKAKFLANDEDAVKAIREDNWLKLHEHRKLLLLVCDHNFLVETRRYYLDQKTTLQNSPEKPRRRRVF